MKSKSSLLRLAIIAIMASVLLCSCFLFGNPTVTLNGVGGALSVSNQVDFDIATTMTGKVVTVQEVRIIFSFGSVHGPAQNVAIELISPGGKNITLFAHNDSDAWGADFVAGTYTFVDDDDDDGLNRIVTYTGVVIPETYQADGDLDDFEDWDLKGTWTLRFRVFNPDLNSPPGTVSSWRVIIEYKEID